MLMRGHGNEILNRKHAFMTMRAMIMRIERIYKSKSSFNKSSLEVRKLAALHPRV
jgi:hypothetical protein